MEGFTRQVWDAAATGPLLCRASVSSEAKAGRRTARGHWLPLFFPARSIDPGRPRDEGKGSGFALPIPTGCLTVLRGVLSCSTRDRDRAQFHGQAGAKVDPKELSNCSFPSWASDLC